MGGKVIIQTYNPAHYAVQAASRHDYAAFYQQEIVERLERRYPPFTRLAKLLYLHTNAQRAQAEAERVADVLRKRIAQLGLDGADVIACAPGFVARLRGSYRWQVVVRGDDLGALLAGLPLPPGWSVDVEPVSLL